MFRKFLSGLLWICAGVLVGALGTVANQISWSVSSSFSLPLGLAVAFLALTALLIAARSLGVSRFPALGVALGALGTILLFSRESAGGSVLVPNNLMGQLWFAGPFVIAAVVIAWPDLQRARARSAPTTP